ncbi:MAG: hypothetical protein NTU85_03740 [Candidatus Kaiserbacteria bacterium]|nr:hypothetical protein [Candidatus Kaiserbacteria bacterium]
MKLKLSLGLLLLFVIGTAVYCSKTRPVFSAAPSNVRDSLSSSQLSYFAVLSSGNTAGNSVVQIGLSGPSKTSDNLFTGDTLSIGIGGTMHIYTIKDIGDTGSFQLNTGTSAVDVGVSAVAIATRSAVHTVSFSPNSTYNGGKWEVLIRVTSTTSESYNDGIPDMNGFDLGTGSSAVAAGDITCPWSGSAAVGTTVSITGTTALTGYYQSFTCTTPTGNAPINTGVTAVMIIGGTHKLINPTPNHTAANEGNADVYTFFLRHYDGSSTLVSADTAVGRLAVNEAVRVTAVIDPTLTFTIDSSAIGTTGCGVPMSANQTSVTATAVPFGSIAIGSTANNLAQRLGIITNGAGYVVTAFEGHVMNNLDGSGTTIPDTNCDASGCNTITAANWTSSDTSNSEFGYSLQALNVGPTLSFTTSGSNFTARAFGVGTANAQTIFYYNATPTVTHYTAVCYRVAATTFQRAGDYENQVVYTATAIF